MGKGIRNVPGRQSDGHAACDFNASASCVLSMSIPVSDQLMNPRITSMENLIAADPGGRNVFGLVVPDQLRLAAQSLRLARRVAIVSGFYIPDATAGETDGPPGAKALGNALNNLGIDVDYVTDPWNAPLFQALGLTPIVGDEQFLDRTRPTHLVSIERAGRSRDGRYRNMRGVDITPTTAPLDKHFIEASRLGLTTIGIGDGGNEIGMGRVFAETLATIPHGKDIACVVPTDFCIAAGVSNWGAFGLVGALSVLAGRNLLPTPDECYKDLERLVAVGGAVDGVSHRREPTVDGLEWSFTLRMLEGIRQLIVPSPLERREPITVGIVGYGQSGRAAATLLSRQGHRVCVSDDRSLSLNEGLVLAGVETGGHSIRFLGQCDLVVVSPGVRADAPIRGELHRRSIPVVSELELAFQLCPYGLIAVTGTVGKRTCVEWIRRWFQAEGRELSVGGNKGLPLSSILLREDSTDPVALAVSSYQLESIVHFRPHIAVLLNIDEAHLDRHRSIAEYVRIKSRIFMNHRPDDVLILPFDDSRLRSLARKHHGRTLFFSRTQPVDRGLWLERNAILLRIDGDTEHVVVNGDCASFELPDSFLTAILVARLNGISISTMSAIIAKISDPGNMAIGFSTNPRPRSGDDDGT